MHKWKQNYFQRIGVGWGALSGNSAAGRDRMCLSVDKNYFALLLSIYNLKNYKIVHIKSESDNYQKGVL